MPAQRRVKRNKLADLVAFGDRTRPARGGQAQNIMIYVYTIKSVAKKFRYVGITNDPERRLWQHNKGYGISAKNFLPFKLVLKEQYNDYREARKRELFLKSGFGRKFLDSLETL